MSRSSGCRARLPSARSPLFISALVGRPYSKEAAQDLRGDPLQRCETWSIFENIHLSLHFENTLCEKTSKKRKAIVISHRINNFVRPLGRFHFISAYLWPTFGLLSAYLRPTFGLLLAYLRPLAQRYLHGTAGGCSQTTFSRVIADGDSSAS